MNRYEFSCYIEGKIREIYETLMKHAPQGSTRYQRWAWKIAKHGGDLIANTYNKDPLTGFYTPISWSRPTRATQ